MTSISITLHLTYIYINEISPKAKSKTLADLYTLYSTFTAAPREGKKKDYVYSFASTRGIPYDAIIITEPYQPSAEKQKIGRNYRGSLCIITRFIITSTTIMSRSRLPHFYACVYI